MKPAVGKSQLFGQWTGFVSTKPPGSEDKVSIGMAIFSVDRDRSDQFTFTFLRYREASFPIPSFATKGCLFRFMDGLSLILQPGPVEIQEIGSRTSFLAFEDFANWLAQDRSVSIEHHFTLSFATDKEIGCHAKGLLEGRIFNSIESMVSAEVALYREAPQGCAPLCEFRPGSDDLVPWALHLEKEMPGAYFRGLGRIHHDLSTTLSREGRYNAFRYWEETLKKYLLRDASASLRYPSAPSIGVSRFSPRVSQSRDWRRSSVQNNPDPTALWLSGTAP